MLKHDARKQILDRAVTRYPKSVVSVLAKIVDLTRVPDWRTSHVEEFSSVPTPGGKLAFLTNLDRRTVHRALKALASDGVIKPSTREKFSYNVNPEALRMFASKYLTTRTRSIETKILNSIRMKFTRTPDKKAAWADVHPEQCKCEPHFCSHPNVI